MVLMFVIGKINLSQLELALLSKVGKQEVN